MGWFLLQLWRFWDNDVSPHFEGGGRHHGCNQVTGLPRILSCYRRRRIRYRAMKEHDGCSKVGGSHALQYSENRLGKQRTAADRLIGAWCSYGAQQPILNEEDAGEAATTNALTNASSLIRAPCYVAAFCSFPLPTNQLTTNKKPLRGIGMTKDKACEMSVRQSNLLVTLLGTKPNSTITSMAFWRLISMGIARSPRHRH